MINKFFYIFLVLMLGTVFWYLVSYPRGFHGQFSSPGQKLIVFDFDGTLCDSSGVVVSEYNKISQEDGFEPVDNLDTFKNI